MTESPGGFLVEVPVFTGPFRVLAALILSRRVDVCDVSVARVTEGFLARAREEGGWSLEEATWFLAVCAALLELKVDRLLPRHQDVEEEDLLALGSSPDLAYARRLELVAVRRVADELARLWEEGGRSFPRQAGPAEEFARLYPDVMESVTPGVLAKVAGDLLRPPSPVDVSHIAPIRVSLAEAIETVEHRLEELGAARFRELVADCRDRIHVVVRFLALLELFRDGKVELSQAETFGEIEVRWHGGRAPSEGGGGP